MRAPLPPVTAHDLQRRYHQGERKFRGAVVTGETLAGANLRGADLADATLGSTCLDEADLSDANLSGANLDRATLRAAVLRNANLTFASLIEANLAGAHLSGARCGDAVIGNTLLLDLDLSALSDAKPVVQHARPSTVDFRSIVKSVRSLELKAFLLRTGMAEVFVEYNVSCAQSVSFEVMKRFLQSTFISYGGPDALFAHRLYEALHRNGVTTFFFGKHAIPGKKLHHVMRDGINAHDRVILVCSKASLGRTGVQNEIEETLAREAREGGASLLIPIRLDDYVLSAWRPKDAGIARTVRDRVVADFCGAERDPDVFQAGVLRLLAALKK